MKVHLFLQSLLLVTIATDSVGQPKQMTAVDVPVEIMVRAMPVFEKPAYDVTIAENIKVCRLRLFTAE